MAGARLIRPRAPRSRNRAGAQRERAVAWIEHVGAGDVRGSRSGVNWCDGSNNQGRRKGLTRVVLATPGRLEEDVPRASSATIIMSICAASPMYTRLTWLRTSSSRSRAASISFTCTACVTAGLRSPLRSQPGASARAGACLRRAWRDLERLGSEHLGLGVGHLQKEPLELLRRVLSRSFVDRSLPRVQLARRRGQVQACLSGLPRERS